MGAPLAVEDSEEPRNQRCDRRRVLATHPPPPVVGLQRFSIAVSSGRSVQHHSYPGAESTCSRMVFLKRQSDPVSVAVRLVVLMGLRSEVARRTRWSWSNTTRDQGAAGQADLQRGRGRASVDDRRTRVRLGCHSAVCRPRCCIWLSRRCPKS